jgi:hypothetical protein
VLIYLGNLFILALSMVFGRRPVFLLSIVILTGIHQRRYRSEFVRGTSHNAYHSGLINQSDGKFRPFDDHGNYLPLSAKPIVRLLLNNPNGIVKCSQSRQLVRDRVAVPEMVLLGHGLRHCLWSRLG